LSKKNQILAKNLNFGKNKILGKHQNFYKKIEILSKKSNFGKKSKVWANIKLFCQKINNFLITILIIIATNSVPFSQFRDLPLQQNFTKSHSERKKYFF